MQRLKTTSKLHIYHNAASHVHGKSPVDSRTLYGIDVEMRSDKAKPYILVLTNQSTALSISFSEQTEADQWFVALTHITGKVLIKLFKFNADIHIGCFQLCLKLCPLHHHIPQDLVAQLKGDSITFWSVLHQHKVMDWKLFDIVSISLNKALHIHVKSARQVYSYYCGLKHMFMQQQCHFKRRYVCV